MTKPNAVNLKNLRNVLTFLWRFQGKGRVRAWVLAKGRRTATLVVAPASHSFVINQGDLVEGG